MYRLPTFFNYEIKKTADGSAYREPALRNNRLYYYIYVSGCDVLFTFLILFCMLLFFFVCIVITFRASRRQQLGRHGDHLADIKVTSMRLVSLGVFLIYHVYSWILNLLLELSVHHFPHGYIPLRYALQIAFMLAIVNSSVNCLICLVYIKEFRLLLCEIWIHCSSLNQDCELASF